MAAMVVRSCIRL